MNLFLDTNALIKLYHEETGSKALNELIEANADNLMITVSDLSKIEFCSALLRLVRTKELDLSAVNQIFDSFESDARAFNVINAENTVKSFAIQLLKFYAYEKSLRTLDALQLSTAVICHSIIPIDFFVSSDQRLLNVAVDFFSTLNVES